MLDLYSMSKSGLKNGSLRPTKIEMRSQKHWSNRTRMKRVIGLTLIRLLAMLAITLQIFLPGTLAVTESNGVDVSQFMCAPLSEMSAETRAATKQIAKLLGEDLPDEKAYGEHCPLCTFVHGAPLPEPAAITIPAAFARETVFVRFEPSWVRQAQGPPLGSRAPPSLI